MKLSFEKIKEITTGAARIERDGDLIRFYRFTAEQDELYKNKNPDHHMKSLATAGMRFVFRTDSETLFLCGVMSSGSSRRYYSIDVFVDGKPVAYIDNFSSVELPLAYAKVNLPLGDFSGKIELGAGEKEVCVYLPWSTAMALREMSVDDGAFVEAVKREKKLLVFGDSITQGYDALRPSNRYASRLSDLLSAEEINKAIGGECFYPALAALADGFSPDYVAVAYGTNDWNYSKAENMKKKCREFYEGVCKNYPDAKVFAITPIWRKDMHEERAFGDFMNVESCIREAVAGLASVSVIRGFEFVPQDEKYFADLRLHPNDEGFSHYFKNLSAQILPLV